MTTDIVAERAVISACLDSQVARKRAAKVVTAADFEHVALAKIWEAMAALDREGQVVDGIIVANACAGDRLAREMLPDLVTMHVVPDYVESYARTVREHATRRRLAHEARLVVERASNPDIDIEGYTASVVTRFSQIRDSGSSEDVEARTLGELLAEEDEPYSWIIPDLLEHSDRFMLTGVEGLGKSMLIRQIIVCAAAGLHPFGRGRIAPIKAVVFDAENSWRQVKRQIRGLALTAQQRGPADPLERVLVECSARIDITRDRDLAHIHQLLDAAQPDVLAIGPLYRLVPRAIQTDDDAAPVLAALDTIRDRGIALLIEAHAGHGNGTHGRDLRPRGSSALLGWPEFGYGMGPGEMPGEVELKPWRGDRDLRHWPDRLSRGGVLPWTAENFHGIPINETSGGNR